MYDSKTTDPTINQEMRPIAVDAPFQSEGLGLDGMGY